VSLLRDRLEQRIAARLAYVRTLDPARVDGIDAADLAVRIERNVVAAAEAIIPKKAEQFAALDREIVGLNWPLFSGFPIGEAVVPILLFRVEERLFWPPSVSWQETAEALERIGTPESKAMAAPLLAGVWGASVPYFSTQPTLEPTLHMEVGYPMTVGASPELLAKLGKTEEEFLREQQAAEAIAEVEYKKSKALVEKLGAEQLWNPFGIATLLAALAEVRANALAFRGTPIPATRPMRAAVQTISRGVSGEWGLLETKGGRSVIKLHWPGPGSKPPHQLALGFPASVDAAIVAGILDELQTDGLRDYLVLHRMAAEQGRTGAIRWSWREHRERTAYDRRIRAGNLNDPKAQWDVTARLWRLKSAELRETVAMPGGKTRFERIGPFGLIDIPAGYGEEGALDLAPIELNPAIYRGAAVGTQKRGRNFTMLPDAAFALDGRALRLAVLLALQMRITRDAAAGTVRITASKLWEWLGSRGGDPKAIPRKRWQATDDTLRKVLAVLEGASVIGTWNREGGEDALPGALYQIDPVAAWRDAVVHRVPPALPPSKAAIPWTGEGLRRWREEHLLSQAAAAAELGVGVATVKRAEGNPTKELGAALVEALARCRAVSRSG